ncbi:MAG: hypothetical protein HKN39_08445 [Flavobacteriales bacterium]|nr:hypothetical protein [Flavobacteriales bacterium]
MKNVFILITLSIILTGCEDDNFVPENEIPELIGEWKLIQVYNDPGDGSGDFVDVFQGKTVTFFEDSTLISNGSLCNNSSTFNEDSSGTYDPGDMIIFPDSCVVQPPLGHSYELGRNLIISYPCDEPCQAKYEKLE